MFIAWESSFAQCALVFAVAGGSGPVEDRRLGVVPEGVELEGPPLIGPDGKEWPNVRRVVFDSLGQRFGFTGIQGGRDVCIVDGESHGSWHFVSGPYFDRVGEHSVFRVGNRLSESKEAWWVLVDGKKMAKNDWIGTPSISPDGRGIAFWTQPGARVTKAGPYDRGDQVFVVLQRKTARSRTWTTRKGVKWSDGLSLNSPVWAEDSSWVASAATDGRQWSVIVHDARDERRVGEPIGGMIQGFAVTPDGKTAAIASSSMPGGFALPPGVPAPPGMKSQSEIVWGKKRFGGDHDGVGSPVFSADGKHLAYKFRKGDKIGIEVDGRASDPVGDFAATPVFRPDGRELAYVVRTAGKVSAHWALTTDGDHSAEGGVCRVVRRATTGKARPKEGPKSLDIADLRYSPDGKRLAYRARSEEGWQIVVDDVAGPIHDEVGPPVFVDPRTVGYGSRDGREIWWRSWSEDGG